MDELQWRKKQALPVLLQGNPLKSVQRGGSRSPPLSSSFFASVRLNADVGGGGFRTLVDGSRRREGDSLILNLRHLSGLKRLHPAAGALFFTTQTDEEEEERRGGGGEEKCSDGCRHFLLVKGGRGRSNMKLHLRLLQLKGIRDVHAEKVT
ncbi:hypothetical protein D5F01_LYC16108 [Larimichthys crocea]|uniref:Uncharacterized protein n=1 Tax=Larimichthys crocea TaxID=215358 RepID=A0A6G0I4G3_LARCR|nr:hypothetical protein D5F01_LYC16108 [Larimichthys crocea]